jgi:hypothetical protein
MYASPFVLDICNIGIGIVCICNMRTTAARFRLRWFPKHGEPQRFVSKNDRLEKADRQAISQGRGQDR